MSTTIIGFPRLGNSANCNTTENILEMKSQSRRSKERLGVRNTGTLSKKKAHWNPIKWLFSLWQLPRCSFPFQRGACFCSKLDLTGPWVTALAKQWQKCALPMKKWFNTNHHYIVPKFEKDTVKLAGHKILTSSKEQKNLDWTLVLSLGSIHLPSNCQTFEDVKAEDFVDSFVAAYQEVFAKLVELGATRIQLTKLLWSKTSDSWRKKLSSWNLYNKLLADKKALWSLASNLLWGCSWRLRWPCQPCQ